MFARLRTIGTLRLLPHLLPRLLRPFDLLPGALVLLRLGLLGTPSLCASALIGLVLRLEPGLLAIWLIWFLRLAIVFGFRSLSVLATLLAGLLALVRLLLLLHPLLLLRSALRSLLRFLFTSSLLSLLLVCLLRIPGLFGLLSILLALCATCSTLGLPLVARSGRGFGGRIGLTSLLFAGCGSLSLARSLGFETGRRNVLRVFLLHRLLELLAILHSLPAMLDIRLLDFGLHLFRRALLFALLHRRRDYDELIAVHPVKVATLTLQVSAHRGLALD